MVASKVFAAALATSNFWAVDAAKCKPYPNHTSFLTMLSGTSAAASSTTYSHVSSSTESAGAVSTSSDAISVSTSHESTVTSMLSTSHVYSSISVGRSSSDITSRTDASTTTSGTSFTITDTTPTAETTTSTDTTTSIDITVATDSTTLIQHTAPTDSTATTDVTTSIDTTTTPSSSVATSETTTTESFWTSTTEASCPIITSSIDDPGFEGDNSGPNRWDYMGAMAGVAVPFQKASSTSQDVPRANTGDQFALLSGGTGSTLATDMWKPMSLDPAKKYQVWFAFAPVSSPDEDWTFSFIIATRKGGHVHRENLVVPKGAPFKYIHRTAMVQGAAGDNLYAFMRINTSPVPRLVAVDDIYVAEYAPSCAVPTEPTELCNSIQGSVPTGPSVQAIERMEGEPSSMIDRVGSVRNLNVSPMPLLLET
ncbi:hypothetical protein F66182_1719 [Fusarium sp. NRRL 66182]|nr:hypothetical protein F66182_1719 [Fusarium sp. NRRL 66182]